MQKKKKATEEIIIESKPDEYRMIQALLIALRLEEYAPYFPRQVEPEKKKGDRNSRP